jgi:hypothetical protein
MRTLLRLLLWNAAFIACVAAIAISLDRGTSDVFGLSLPYITGVWLLFLGARFASRRVSVIAIAVISSLLFLFQCVVIGFILLLSSDNRDLATQLAFLIAAVLVTGVALVWWFTSSKRQPGLPPPIASGPADPGGRRAR